MKCLLKKELRLTASPLSYIFIAFALMAMIPQYPILVGGFFVCFGIFHTFQAGREAGDTLYTAMLPVAKSDVVRAKFAFTVFIQTVSFFLMSVLTVFRMCVLFDAQVYVDNTLMNANLAFLGYILMIFASFNFFFVGGFFKTAYKIGVPFLVFGTVAFLIVGVGEALHFLPGLGDLNAPAFRPCQLTVLLIGAFLYLALTLFSVKLSEKRFNRIDL